MVSIKEVFRVSTPTMCICLLLTQWSVTASPKYLLTAPKFLRFDVEESVVITIFEATEPVQLKLYLQDYPFRKWRTDPVKQLIQPGVPTELKITAPSNNLYTRRFEEHFVLLTAKGASSELQFEKEVEILVTPQNGLVFIQTDKPIYSPGQQVQVRIIQVDHLMKPRDAPVRIDILDPKGIVYEASRAGVSTPNGLCSTSLTIPAFSDLGNWWITVHYGKNYTLKESVQFEVNDYVLPTFSVTVKTPKHILNTTKGVRVKVQARYVFGKKVNGPVDVRFVVQTDTGRKILGRKTGKMTNGRFKTKFSTRRLRRRGADFWFLEGAKLYAEATVRDHGSGIKQIGKSSYTKFVTAPYTVTFSRIRPCFKPGLSFPVEIDVRHLTGKPKKTDIRITTVFRSSNDDALPSSFTTKVLTNEKGHASAIVTPPSNAIMTTIQVSTLTEVPLTEKYNMKSAFSPSSSFLQATVKTQQPVSVGTNAVIQITATKAFDVSTLVYMVTSGGQTIHTAVVKEPFFPLNLSIPVVASMSPSARLLVYYLHGDEVVADSTLIDVVSRCKTKVIVKPMTGKRKSKTYKPSDFVKVTVKADPRTKVAIQAVDQAVYLMNHKYRMTAANVLNSMKIFDNGYGIGGGLSSEDVLQSMGLTVLSNTRVRSPNCIEIGSFKKKRVPLCSRHRSRRSKTSRSFSGPGRRVGRASDKPYTFEDIPKLQDVKHKIQGRQNFNETWMYQVVDTGSRRRHTFLTTVPDSMTTWHVEAFSINQDFGFCVAEPTTVRVYTGFFIEASLPHSIIQHEQVEVRATIFNYGKVDLLVYVYTIVGHGVCAKSKSGEASKPVSVTVKKRKSETVTFPIVPLDVGIHTIKVIAISATKSSDKILKKLNVLVRPASKNATSCNFPTNVTLEEFRIPRDLDKIPRFDDEDYSCRRDTRVPSAEYMYRSRRSVRGSLTWGRSSGVVSKLRVCTKFLVSRENEIDVGLFSGFEPIKASLDRLIVCNSTTFVMNYHITSRTIVLQLSKVPCGREVCVEFFIQQRYRIGKTQPVAINWLGRDVDSKCTVFYHPNSGSELLKPICSNSTGQCICD